MELAKTCVLQITVMFILVAVGFFCGKKKMIDSKSNTVLSNFVLTVVNPTMIFMSYQADYQPERLKNLLLSFLLSFCSFLLTIGVITVIYRKRDDDGAILEKFAGIYSNCAFMGIPLINSLYGDEGVLYLTGYVTFFNIFIWTHGCIMYSGKKDKKSILHAFTSPSVIAIAAGLLCFLLQLRLPDIITDAANHIKNLNTPLAMIIAGVTISGINLKNDIKNVGIYRACFLRLILSPLLFWAVFRWFDIPETVYMTVLATSACPVAAMSTMFAHRYNKNAEFSSEIFAFSTVFSAFTMPLIVLLGMYL
ncbi:MAG: AEC family transporter [Oscillospiraceae bacterium]|nr:AEC family transporter [Oscillospiraceae bacterium]